MPRIQLDVNERKREEIELLTHIADVPTIKDLFNNALTLLKWAIVERARGNTIASLNEAQDTYKELEMPVLSAASRNTHLVQKLVSAESPVPVAETEDARDSARRGARELKERAEELAKESVERQRESVEAAVEAGKHAYREEKRKR